MYLKLNEIQPRTEEWIKASAKAGKWSPNAVINGDGELIDARLKKGLMPTPLTRDLKWGVPVPVEGEDNFGMRGKVLCTYFYRQCARKNSANRHHTIHRCLGK